MKIEKIFGKGKTNNPENNLSLSQTEGEKNVFRPI